MGVCTQSTHNCMNAKPLKVLFFCLFDLSNMWHMISKYLKIKIYCIILINLIHLVARYFKPCQFPVCHSVCVQARVCVCV